MKKLLFLSLLLPLQIYAQSVPGYLGKRSVIGFKAQAMPSIISFGRNQQESNFALRYKSTIDFDYIVSKASSIGGALEFINTSVGNSYDFIFRPSNYPDDEDFLLNDMPVLAVNLAFDYKAHFKHYSPLGGYLLLQGGISFVNFDDLTTNVDSISILGGSSISYFAGIGYGVNRAISENLMLNAGITFNFHFKGLANLESLEYAEFEFDGSEADEEYIEERALARIAGGELARFHIGISYLF